MRRPPRVPGADQRARHRPRSSSVTTYVSPLVHVDRTGVHAAVGGGARRPCRARARCGAPTMRTTLPGAAQRHVVGRPVRVGPRTSPPGRRRSRPRETRASSSGRHGRPEDRLVALGERQLGRGGGQVRCRARSGFCGSRTAASTGRRTAPRGGGPGRCRAGRRRRPAPPATRAPARPARPACCQSEARRARPAGEQHRVEAADVDAQLEGVGRGEPAQPARRAAPRSSSRRSSGR